MILNSGEKRRDPHYPARCQERLHRHPHAQSQIAGGGWGGVMGESTCHELATFTPCSLSSPVALYFLLSSPSLLTCPLASIPSLVTHGSFASFHFYSFLSPSSYFPLFFSLPHLCIALSTLFYQCNFEKTNNKNPFKALNYNPPK